MTRSWFMLFTHHLWSICIVWPPQSMTYFIHFDLHNPWPTLYILNSTIYDLLHIFGPLQLIIYFIQFDFLLYTFLLLQCMTYFIHFDLLFILTCAICYLLHTVWFPILYMLTFAIYDLLQTFWSLQFMADLFTQFDLWDDLLSGPFKITHFQLNNEGFFHGLTN